MQILGIMIPRRESNYHCSTREWGLRARLLEAHAEVSGLNERRRGRRRYPGPSVLREAIDTILTHYRVHGLLHI